MGSNRQAINILILGYGEMGHAFESLLASRHRLAIWSRGREQQGLCTLDTEVARADLIIFCLPVMAHESVATRIAKHIKANSRCITIAKGLDETARTAVEILQKQLPKHVIGGIYGPMIAEELIQNRPGFAQLASKDDSLYRDISDCFHGTHLYLQASSDLIGSSWCVILKNVYALLLGMADGLQLGDNMRGYLMVKALEELSTLVKVLGGDSRTPFQLAGLGDLITTATSRNSHHHKLGMDIGEGRAVELSGEGVHTLKVVMEQMPFDYSTCDLFKLCVSIIKDTRKCADYFSDYLLRQAG